MPAKVDTMVDEVKVEKMDVLDQLRDSWCSTIETASLTRGKAMLTEDTVMEELKKVIDPELFINIVDLGLIYVVDLKDSEEEGKKNILIDMTMTSPACPAGPQLIANSKNVVSRLEQVNEVEVRIVMDPAWTPDRMTEDARDQLGMF